MFSIPRILKNQNPESIPKQTKQENKKKQTALRQR